MSVRLPVRKYQLVSQWNDMLRKSKFDCNRTQMSVTLREDPKYLSFFAGDIKS